VTPKRARAWRIWPACTGALLLSACGCASFWDEVTSREFEFKNLWSKPPEPLVVLRDSTDNHRKAEALARLQEPLTHGGTREQQEIYIQILTRAALNENKGQFEPMSRDPLCRLSAIRVLGEYRDPRAIPVLEKAYLDANPFAPEMNAMLRQQALASLEKTGNPEARHLLIQAARQPGASAVSSQTERQYILDEKLAAVRALSKFTNYEAVDTLVYLLETDKDVAVRHCAHQSLKTATKKNLPEDPKAWRDMLARGPEATPDTGVIQRVTGRWTRDDANKK
jgi:hypothetical protein